MKQSCVSAFTRVTRSIALAAVALIVGASALSAQAATGKLEGKVRDQQGAPIANAQVIIVGTRFGAQTNADGYYFINLIPAGTISLEVSFIGYKKTRVTDIRIPSGQTITADVTLESTPVEVTEITVVAAQNELVPRDAVTTKQNVEGDYADNLPVDRIVNVLALQPGVVASTGGGTLSIRGGRTDEQSDVRRRRAGRRGQPRRPASCTGGGNAVGSLHQRLRRRLDHDRRLVGRVRRRAVGRHLDLDPHRRRQVQRRRRLRVRRALRQQRQPRLQPGHRQPERPDRVEPDVLHRRQHRGQRLRRHRPEPGELPATSRWPGSTPRWPSRPSRTAPTPTPRTWTCRSSRSTPASATKP